VTADRCIVLTSHGAVAVEEHGLGALPVVDSVAQVVRARLSLFCHRSSKGDDPNDSQH